MENLSWIIPSGVLVTLIIFIFKSNRDNDERVSRVYERLDEVKKDHDQKFQTKELCAVHLAQLKDTVEEIKIDVKMILKKANGEH